MTIVYLQHSPFFTEQLTAFQVWLAMGAENRDPPEQLPIVLQVLLSQVHRLRALDLLGRFLDLGPWAVNLVSWYVIKQGTVVPCWWQVLAVKQVDMGHIATLKNLWNCGLVALHLRFWKPIAVHQNESAFDGCLSMKKMWHAFPWFAKVSNLVLMRGEKEAIGLIFRWYSLTIAHYKLHPDELTAVVMLWFHFRPYPLASLPMFSNYFRVQLES